MHPYRDKNIIRGPRLVQPTQDAQPDEILAEAALAFVPEPNTALLVGMGFSVLSGSRRARGALGAQEGAE